MDGGGAARAGDSPPVRPSDARAVVCLQPARTLLFFPRGRRAGSRGMDFVIWRRLAASARYQSESACASDLIATSDNPSTTRAFNICRTSREVAGAARRAC